MVPQHGVLMIELLTTRHAKSAFDPLQPFGTG